MAAVNGCPTPEQKFNALLSFEVILLGKSCMNFSGMELTPGILASTEQMMSTLVDLNVNPSEVSWNEVERHSIQSKLDEKFPRSHRYLGNLVASIILPSRVEHFLGGAQESDILTFPAFARDYILIMLKSYDQDTMSLFQLTSIVSSNLIAHSTYE